MVVGKKERKWFFNESWSLKTKGKKFEQIHVPLYQKVLAVEGLSGTGQEPDLVL